MQFLLMHGYACYVWPAFGITFLILVLNVWWPLRRKKQILNFLRRYAS